MKEDLTHRIDAIDKDIRHEELSSNWTEQATERENDEVLDSLGNSSEQELTMVNSALKRIDSGDYFSCSICGDDIPTARLELLPFATHCVNCEEKLTP
ncbi:MAG: TraR/DksA C4-type zinc finger protein [Woeseiaceae bacterium]